ncbi:hypothetical protein BV394_01940 [Brevirhabdus pacifica]|uniref:Uncharacterized protein n=1 Tax=Brevirhabdus pacifica TaxID=1267768 RepID=A0A1U7DF92_9RHOB|nr:hypothetical protein [Brevirhabdus pacifica]APX88642.1 hypothetical protein BV394_01940 [Brevirhabdus pacifica]OWU79916.1 hypothetical protein ATO5_02630 [Loktanella sp. 22II-4b]PJJ86858.1 hypothetical protein CLV77_1418 [Brevirhabdus pacifica]
MSYSPVIYDWRSDCVPLSQVFRAGGRANEGGMTLGGINVVSPAPGGRGELHLEFGPFATTAANKAASWTISRMMNGAIMRIGLWNSVQLVPNSALGISNGLTWSNGQTWSSGAFWRSRPSAAITAAAGRGTTTLTADLGTYGEIVEIGHVVGVKAGGFEFAHMVEEISYDASDVATMTVSPPLRRAVTTSDTLQFRPSMLVQCMNAREVMNNFQSGRHMAFSKAEFVEALV